MKWSYWLIGGVITTVLFFLPLVYLQNYFGREVLSESLLFETYKVLNKVPLIFNPPNQSIKLLIAFILYFLIGAIIGFIISKLKNKSNQF